MSHIPLEAFFRKPERAIARLSPDGRHVGFLGRWERRMNLFVRQLETGEEHRLTTVARDIVQFVWASSERLAFVIDTEGDENWHVWGVDLAGGTPCNLTPLEHVQARLLSDLKALDDVILVSLNDRDARLHDAWRINVATGERSLAAINPGSVSEWLADYSGRVRVAVAVEHTTTKVMARDNEQAPWRTILTCGMLDDMTPLWFAADEQRVYAASNLGRSATAIVEIDLNDGQERGVLAEQDGVDLQELFVSERRRVPTHITVDAERPHFLCLDLAQARLQQIVDQRFPGRVNRFTSSSRDERVWTVVSLQRSPSRHVLARRCGKRHHDSTVRGRTVAARRRVVCHGAYFVSSPRRTADPCVSHEAVEHGRPSAAGRQSARRSLASRLVGVQP